MSLSVQFRPDRWPRMIRKRVRMFSAMRLRKKIAYISATVLMIGGFGVHALAIQAPGDFPVGTVVKVEEGQTLGGVAEDLQTARVVRSPVMLRLAVMFANGDQAVRAGDYFFNAPRSVFAIARQITTGDFGLVPVRVTVPEGATREQIARLMDRKFDQFDQEIFLAATEGKEGYLFPDTYFFLPTVDAIEIARAMEQNFTEKIKDLEDEIKKFGRSLEDVVIMASMLEKEGSGLAMRQEIAGVLWNRVAIDMPLQVDAVFLAINGKSTYDLTLSDLAMDSPYNTYRYAGLPPGAIANPSLDSLLAAVTPAASDYLYYLSDRSGRTYYAENFEEHKANRRLYLD